jgi:hypothetical protein
MACTECAPQHNELHTTSAQTGLDSRCAHVATCHTETSKTRHMPPLRSVSLGVFLTFGWLDKVKHKNRTRVALFSIIASASPRHKIVGHYQKVGKERGHQNGCYSATAPFFFSFSLPVGIKGESAHTDTRAIGKNKDCETSRLEASYMVFLVLGGHDGPAEKMTFSAWPPTIGSNVGLERKRTSSFTFIFSLLFLFLVLCSKRAGARERERELRLQRLLVSVFFHGSCILITPLIA